MGDNVDGLTFGVGMIPIEDDFYVFSTCEGIWRTGFTLSEWRCENQQGNFHSCFNVGFVFRSENSMEIEYSLHPPGEDFLLKLDQLKEEECSVCYENVLSFRMISIDECGHRFCSDCISGRLQSAFHNGEFGNVDCPANGCNCILEDHLLQSALSPQQFVRFKRFRDLARLRLDPNCRWCPNPDCAEGVIGNPEHPEFPKLLCQGCGTRFCFECTDFWHQGDTCQQNRDGKLALANRDEGRYQEEEAQTKVWLQKYRALPCPKCQAIVQKAEGCNHMKCPCGGEFCWICGEDTSQIGGNRDLPEHYNHGPCQGKQFSNELDLPDVDALGALEPDPEPIIELRRRQRWLPRVIRRLRIAILFPVRRMRQRAAPTPSSYEDL